MLVVIDSSIIPEVDAKNVCAQARNGLAYSVPIPTVEEKYCDISMYPHLVAIEARFLEVSGTPQIDAPNSTA